MGWMDVTDEFTSEMLGEPVLPQAEDARREGCPRGSVQHARRVRLYRDVPPRDRADRDTNLDRVGRVYESWPLNRRTTGLTGSA